MTTQICPNCKEDSFTWSIDEDVSRLTLWTCYNCGYRAYEDESFGTKPCIKCCNATTKLEDEDRKYWYCFSCYNKELIKVKSS